MEFIRMDPDFFIPFLIFSIPIIAIVGGITAGIVRSIGNQRLIELAQRERIAAIERGIDPSKLPVAPGLLSRGNDDLAAMYLSHSEMAKRRSANLTIGGIITLFVGMGLCAFLWLIDGRDGTWGVGLIPMAAGAGMLLSAWLTRPTSTEVRPTSTEG